MGARFEALDKGVLMASLDPRYTQVAFNSIPVQVCCRVYGFFFDKAVSTCKTGGYKNILYEVYSFNELNSVVFFLVKIFKDLPLTCQAASFFAIFVWLHKLEGPGIEVPTALRDSGL